MGEAVKSTALGLFMLLGLGSLIALVYIPLAVWIDGRFKEIPTWVGAVLGIACLLTISFAFGSQLRGK